LSRVPTFLGLGVVRVEFVFVSLFARSSLSGGGGGADRRGREAATFLHAFIFGFHGLAEYACSLLGEVSRGRVRGRATNDNWFVAVFFHGADVDLNGVMQGLGDRGSQCLIF
jgi:hypothetical protein